MTSRTWTQEQFIWHFKVVVIGMVRCIVQVTRMNQFITSIRSSIGRTELIIVSSGKLFSESDDNDSALNLNALLCINDGYQKGWSVFTIVKLSRLCNEPYP